MALKTLTYLSETWTAKIQLVKIGQSSPAWLAMIRSYGLEQKVINLGVVPRECLPEIYNAVDLFFFPSLYEGFGWPPLEAMACGIPVVASNAGSLPEVMGNIETMRNPFNFIGFAEIIRKILTNEVYRSELIEQGFRQTAKFTWKETAIRILEVYEYVLS